MTAARSATEAELIGGLGCALGADLPLQIIQSTGKDAPEMSNQTLKIQDATPHDRLSDIVERYTDGAVASNELRRLPLEQPHVIRRVLENLLPAES